MFFETIVYKKLRIFKLPGLIMIWDMCTRICGAFYVPGGTVLSL